MVCLDGIFISDAHALAVLPNIAHFALDEEFPSAFVIVAWESRENVRRWVRDEWMAKNMALGG
jgi:hypothetical protein